MTNCMKRLIDALCMTFGMFSLIPVPRRWDDKAAPTVPPLMPLVGIAIGLIWFAVAWVTGYFGLNGFIRAVLLLFTPWIITGLIHIDGFIDTCDALLSRADREKKLLILKDSHVGAYGVVALVILSFTAFAACLDLSSKLGAYVSLGFVPLQTKLWLLLLIPVMSRSLTGLAQVSMRKVSEKGYGAYFSKDAGSKARAALILTLAVMVGLSIFFAGLFGLYVSLGMAAVFTLAIWRASRSIGGINGDLLGYSLTLSEVAGLVVLAVV